MLLKKRAFIKVCNSKFRHSIRKSKPYLKLVEKCLKIPSLSNLVTSIQIHEDLKLGENAQKCLPLRGVIFFEQKMI